MSEASNAARIDITMDALGRLSAAVLRLQEKVEAIEHNMRTQYPCGGSSSSSFEVMQAQTPQLLRMESDSISAIRIKMMESFTGADDRKKDELTVVAGKPRKEELMEDEPLAGKGDDPRTSTVTDLSHGTLTRSNTNQFLWELGNSERREENGDFNYSHSAYEDLNANDGSTHAYEFAESAWDIGMFAFSRILRLQDSLGLLFTFMVNAAMQICLICVLWAPFTSEVVDETTLDDAKQWRVTVAHDLRWMDTVTQQSLARLVCSSKNTYMSGSFKGFTENLVQYHPREYLVDMGTFQPEYTGEMVCLAASVIWWFTCFLEFRGIFHCLESICILPSGPRTQILFLQKESVLEIHAFGVLRKLWCLFVLSTRFAVAIALAYIGTKFLIHTLSLRELILNAVALELMLGLDEVVHEVMAPHTVHRFLSLLQPIPRSVFLMRSAHSIGCDRNTLGFLGFFLTMMLLTMPLLFRQGDMLEQAHDILCGGYLDFVFADDPGGAIVAYPSFTNPRDLPKAVGPTGGTYAVGADNYRWRAIWEIIEDPDAVNRNPETSLSDGAAALSGSSLGLRERPGIPIGERMAELNPLCTDLGKGSMVWPTNFVAIMLGTGHPIFDPIINNVTARPTCVDGLEYCNHDTAVGIAMRQWCSETCGCNLANSSLILSTRSMGCPNSCADSRLYEASLEEASCEDSQKSSTAFQQYVKGVKYLQQSYSSHPTWYSMFGGWIAGLERDGCAGHVIYNPSGGFFGDLCTKTAFNLKPLQHLCPVTCKCKDPFTRAPSSQPDLCPRSCTRLSPSP